MLISLSIRRIDACAPGRYSQTCRHDRARRSGDNRGSGVVHDYIEFFRQFRSRFETTGAIAPSSRFLASALTRPLGRRTAPARILEIGPGTGAVTKRIVRLLGPDDRLDLVELNERFAEILARRYGGAPQHGAPREAVQIHVCPLQEFEPQGTYDFIVSGLPLNNFSADLVGEIFETCFRLLSPGGVLSYFEYMYVRPVRKLVAGERDKTRLTRIDAIMNSYLSEHRIRRDWVFVNLPPAWVQHLQSQSRTSDFIQPAQ